MAYVAMDADAVQKLIDGLSDFGDDCEHYRSGAIACNDRQGWHAPLLYMPQTLTNDLVGLDGLKQELKGRLEAAKAANDSGQTWQTSDGWLQYYVPDEAEDTLINVKKYNHVDEVNQARADATRLKNDLGSGTVDEVRKSAGAYKDSYIYANAFCRTYGVGSMMDDVSECGSDESLLSEVVPLFGGMWSKCSGGPNAVYVLADDINVAIREDLGTRVPAMDALLSEAGIVYDVNFLVSLAEKVEDIRDHPGDTVPRGEGNNIRFEDQNIFLKGRTGDPLAAVLHGMANNPEAANLYLAPPDPESLVMDGSSGLDDKWEPSQKAKERMEMLRSRGWGKYAMEGLAGAFAAASSQRVKPAPGNDNDERAAWATGNGLSILAAQGFPSSQEAAGSIGVLLGNCSQEMINMANKLGTTPKEGAAFRLAPLYGNGVDESTVRSSLAQLMCDASTSKEAAYAMGAGATNYSMNKVEALADSPGGASAEAIKDTYSQQHSLYRLMSIVDKEAASAAYNGTQATLGAASSLPMVGWAGTLAGSAQTALVTPSDLTTAAALPSLRDAATLSALRAGLVQPPDPADPASAWLVKGTDGKLYLSLEDVPDDPKTAKDETHSKSEGYEAWRLSSKNPDSGTLEQFTDLDNKQLENFAKNDETGGSGSGPGGVNNTVPTPSDDQVLSAFKKFYGVE